MPQGTMESPVMTLIILSVLIGIVAGLRTMTAPAAVAVGARYGAVAVAGTPLAFMGYDYKFELGEGARHAGQAASAASMAPRFT